MAKSSLAAEAALSDEILSPSIVMSCVAAAGRSAREMMKALATETAYVAKAENIALPFANPVAAAEEVARRTAANHSSMLQDVLRGAPTEIDAICGAVVKTGQKHAIDMSTNWACWKLVKALEG